jgi:proteasome lid subunit RPN8/RPN11
MKVKPDNPAHPAHANHLISTNGRTVERIWHPDTPLFESVQSELTLACFTNKDEVCGFISEDQDIYYVDNVHEEPRRNFLLDEDSFKSVMRDIYEFRESRVLGIFHTHPNNVVWPSPRDIVGWPNPDLKWRYFIATNMEVVEWALK